MTVEAPRTDPGTAPEMSVVVTLVSGHPDRLRTCLTGLHEQDDAPSLEVLVPYDDPVAEVCGLSADFPEVRFLRAAGLETAVARSGASREHHDDLRTLGLKHARGRIVAMVEDVGVPTPGWCRALADALDRHPRAGAVGGGMACGSPRLLNRAICFSDFWRYQEPVPEGPAAYVSDANVGYRRDALEAVRERWDDVYHETVVHFALAERGYEVWQVPAATIRQERGPVTWRDAWQERYVWGRSFAGTRVRQSPWSTRLTLAALSPALPFVLSSRIVRIALARERFWGELLPALPIVWSLTAVWSVGEAVGYLTGRPD